MPLQALFIQIARNIGLIGVTTGAYFLLGLLGLLFKIPNEPIGILMPPNGLAVASTLLFGVRVLPAIAIGSFCVMAWNFDFNNGYLLLYAASAIGSCFLAHVSTFLVRKVIGFPNPLLNGREIVVFFLLTGPLASIISASIGVTVLCWLGIVSSVEAPLAWGSWWMGDSLGVLIFTPLMLILLAEPEPIWIRRRITVGLPITTLFLLVSVMVGYLNGVAKEQYSQQLKEKSIFISQALADRIQMNIYALQVLKGYLLNGNSIASTKFLALAKSSMLPYPEINSISWGKFKENSHTPALYMSAFNTLTGENQFWSPVTFIPLDIKHLLFEIASKRTNQGLLTEHDNLKLVIPINKPELQEDHATGFITANLKITKLVYETLESLNTDHCKMTISREVNAFRGSLLIFSNISNNALPYQNVSIPVLNETWQLQFFHDFDEKNVVTYSRMSWLVFLGLWFTGIMGIVLLHLTGRHFRTEVLIDERNKILLETKTAAEQANQAKDRFLAKISHELRTPLNGISGFAQLLEKKPSLTDDDKKQVTIIRQCSNDLLKLINDILDISAIETQQIKLDKIDFNFARLLNDIVHVCKFKADEKKLQLIAKNNCLPRTFCGDIKRIRQIIINLVDNAIKYTAKGVVTITASYQDEALHISVDDSGIGIDNKDLERIFSPFVQISSDNFNHDGIGLGLSIANELVHLMDGELTVTSQLGIGSHFKVVLPLPVGKSNKVHILPDLMDESSGVYNASVLVIDDNDINLIFMVGLLEELGCKVDSAMNGQAGLKLIQQNEYDLALIDINMPVMNGLELAKTLRMRRINLSLVAVSAYADNEKIKEAINAGFDAYLTKPIEEAQLIEIIQESLEP